MSDETPAPERPRDELPRSAVPPGDIPRYEDGTPAPPPRRPLAAPPSAGSVKQGLLALGAIVGGMVVLEVLLYLASRYYEGAAYGDTFWSSQTLIWLAGLVALIVAAIQLPPRSRNAMLSGCAISIGTVFMVMVVTCGVLLLNG
jgi:hypothetical protein